MEEIAEACIRKGISVLAITDHCDIQYYTERDMPGCIRGSVEEAERLAERFDGKLTILKGIEIGEGLWNREYTDEILRSHSYDEVIGSVHAVRYSNMMDPYSVIDFSELSEEELDGYLRAYFCDVYETAEKLPYDVMAHLTCPLRYINGKYRRGVDAGRYAEQIERILTLVIERSLALEVNTSGIGTAYGELLPDRWIVKRYRELGGSLITLGSDAHVPENVGKGFDDALSFLRECGFESYCFYRERRPVFVSI